MNTQAFIDPICGMTVELEHAAGKSVVDGQTIAFCSTHCKAEFDRDPSRHLPAPPTAGCCGSGGKSPVTI